MGYYHDDIWSLGPSELKFGLSGSQESKNGIFKESKIEKSQKPIFQLQMALKSVPNVLKRPMIPILKGIDMGILCPEGVYHIKLKA